MRRGFLLPVGSPRQVSSPHQPLLWWEGGKGVLDRPHTLCACWLMHFLAGSRTVHLRDVNIIQLDSTLKNHLLHSPQGRCTSSRCTHGAPRGSLQVRGAATHTLSRADSPPPPMAASPSTSCAPASPRNSGTRPRSRNSTPASSRSAKERAGPSAIASTRRALFPPRGGLVGACGFKIKLAFGVTWRDARLLALDSAFLGLTNAVGSGSFSLQS